MSLDGQLEGGQQNPTEAQQSLNSFWPKVTEDIRQLTQSDLRQQELPLARIKRIMKLDDEVKMISAEAPVLFSKAAEIFITELTLRAWIHTEDNKRRTLQRNDIAMAITKYDQFDFLIDIVPRDELKPTKSRDDGNRTGVPADQIAQHYQAVLQQSTANNSNSSSQTVQPTNVQPQTIQIVHAGGQTPSVQSSGTTTASTTQPQQQGPQIIQLQAQSQPQQNQAQAQQSQQTSGGIQIIQQIIGPDGQIQQIPIQLTPQQLQMIKLQMSGATQQPIIIQTAPIQAVSQQPQTVVTSQPQIIQLQQGGGQPVYITQSQTQQQ
ncbi:nuclear transcription factor Y subunit gamma-like isoform X3 [Portunus trituberculatus]|uniref:nuclear transcription factor Y subunit gamma-like isoform X3 n=1 Tax=Portunus trituberculatus TaxID=210409 RepID=UPI001E1CC8DB|nr:nuclear transcription factor Y subunit gamma-like isoform X3 [Portunus trituberculatus]